MNPCSLRVIRRCGRAYVQEGRDQLLLQGRGEGDHIAALQPDCEVQALKAEAPIRRGRLQHPSWQLRGQTSDCPVCALHLKADIVTCKQDHESQLAQLLTEGALLLMQQKASNLRHKQATRYTSCRQNRMQAQSDASTVRCKHFNVRGCCRKAGTTLGVHMMVKQQQFTRGGCRAANLAVACPARRLPVQSPPHSAGPPHSWQPGHSPTKTYITTPALQQLLHRHVLNHKTGDCNSSGHQSWLWECFADSHSSVLSIRGWWSWSILV